MCAMPLTAREKALGCGTLVIIGARTRAFISVGKDIVNPLSVFLTPFFSAPCSNAWCAC